LPAGRSPSIRPTVAAAADIAPGEYQLFAWEDAEAGAPEDPEFRKRFQTRAVTVKVGVNDRLEVQLRAISVVKSAAQGR
jgi:hypothetical protein